MARNVYTVKQVNAYIKNMFTQDFMLNRIYVKGEDVYKRQVLLARHEAEADDYRRFGASAASLGTG